MLLGLLTISALLGPPQAPAPGADAASCPCEQWDWRCRQDSPTACGVPQPQAEDLPEPEVPEPATPSPPSARQQERDTAVRPSEDSCPCETWDWRCRADGPIACDVPQPRAEDLSESEVPEPTEPSPPSARQQEHDITVRVRYELRQGSLARSYRRAKITARVGAVAGRVGVSVAAGIVLASFRRYPVPESTGCGILGTTCRWASRPPRPPQYGFGVAAGAAIGVVGAVMLLVSSTRMSEIRTEARLKVRATASRHGAGAVVLGRF